MNDIDEETALAIGGDVFMRAVAILLTRDEYPSRAHLRDLAQRSLLAGRVFVEEATHLMELSRAAGEALALLGDGDCADVEKP